MDKKISVELFRFNHKTDYLPYYKKHQVMYKENDTVLDILNKLNEKEKFSFDGVEDFGVKINNLFLTVDTLISELIEKTSNELVIEPVSIYRTINDLTIKNDDFFAKLSLFDNYLSQEQKESYTNSLQLDYYCSNTLNFNKDYIGDHSLIIAADLISDNAELEKEILNIISNEESGAWYTTSVKSRLLNSSEAKEAKIAKMIQLVTKTEAKISQESVELTENISQEFSDFNIAAYDSECTSTLQKLIENSKAKYINTESKNDDMALECTKVNKSFSYKIAGKILLDALDNNADFIVVKDSDTLSILDGKQKEIEKAVGRDISLPVVSLDQFNNLVAGEKDTVKLGFDKHKVNISFL